MVEIMKPYENILPTDKVGKTLVKNGSYDISVENTTICIKRFAMIVKLFIERNAL